MNRPDTKAVKAELASRIATVARPEYIASLLPDDMRAAAPPLSEWRTEVLQLDGTGAATVEIALDGRDAVFAKLYPDHDEGARIHERLVGLRRAGFDDGHRYRSVEPLTFVREHGMLLTRRVEGDAVSEHVGGDETALRAGVEEAAAWLGRLHCSPVRLGPPRSLLDSGELLPLARRMAKVTSERPHFTPLAVEMVRALERVADGTGEGLLVQTHGQYRPIHVFVADGAVSVIDLDRTRPSDPARDVAEFVFRLRMMTWVATGSAVGADVPTAAFVQTYADRVEDPSYLQNFSFHWARHALHSFSKQLKDLDAVAGRFMPQV
jgi:hypothetical protein